MPFSIGRKLLAIAVMLLAILSTPWQPYAAELKGRLSSALYGYEKADQTHWRPYVRLSSTALLWKSANRQSLSFHSGLRWTTDLSDSNANATDTYLYHGYLKYSGLPGSTRLYLGRQFVFSTLGSGVVDGIRIRTRPLDRLRVDVHAGSPVDHQESGTLQNISEQSVVGTRIGYRLNRRTEVAINYYQRRIDSEMARHRIGLDGMITHGRSDLYGRVAFSLIDHELDGIIARIVTRPTGWRLSAEIDWRKPSVYGTSIFSLVEADNYTGIRTEINRDLGRSYQLVGQLHTELSDFDTSWRTLLGLRSGLLMLAWHHRDGYAGKLDGLRGYATVKLRDNLEAYWTGDISEYKIQEEQLERMDAYASSLGLSFRPGANMQVRLEGQYLRNAVDDSDLRLYLRISKGFHIGAADAGSER